MIHVSTRQQYKEFKMNKKGEVTKAVLVNLESKKDEKTGRMMMVPVEGSEKEIPVRSCT